MTGFTKNGVGSGLEIKEPFAHFPSLDTGLVFAQTQLVSKSKSLSLISHPLMSTEEVSRWAGLEIKEPFAHFPSAATAAYCPRGGGSRNQRAFRSFPIPANYAALGDLQIC